MVLRPKAPSTDARQRDEQRRAARHEDEQADRGHDESARRGQLSWSSAVECAAAIGPVFRGKCLARQSLVREQSQRCCIVDVVPRGQQDRFQTEFRRSLQRLLGNAGRAPGNVLEQPTVGALHAEQVISSVGGGPQDNAIALWPQGLDRRDEHRGRQGRAIGIQYACRAVTEIEQ